MRIFKRIAALFLCVIMLAPLGLTACTDNRPQDDLYTLSFETNGGTDISDISLPAGAAIEWDRISTTKDFYTFNRWLTEDNNPATFTLMPQTDTTVYADWSPISVYTVTFNSNGGGAVDKQVYAVGETVKRPADPVRQNYVFGGWYTDVNLSEESRFDFISAKPVQNINLYAAWTTANNVAVVSVYLNNELIESYAVIKGGYIGEPSLPQIGNDVIFSDWYNKPDVTDSSAQRYAFPLQINGETNIYCSYSTKGLSNSTTGSRVSGYIGSSATVVIKYGTKEISEGAFKGNTIIKKVVIPATVTVIEKSAFEECTGLNNIVIPAGILNIGENAFLGCSSLEKLSLPSSTLQVINNNAFYDTAIRTLDLSGFTKLTKIGNGAFGNCRELSVVKFPQDSAVFTEIGNNAFYNCPGINEIFIPKSVTKIGGGAFSKCTGIKSFETHEDNPNYRVAADGNLYDKNMTTFMLFIQKEGETTFTIESTSDVTRIESNALYGASLTKISILKAGIQFGRGAFERCDGLTELELADLGSQNVNLPYLFGAPSAQLNVEGNRYTPENLQKVTFSSLTQLPDYAFYGCNGLTEVETAAAGGFTKVGSFAFAYTALSSFTIGANLSDFGVNVFEGCNELKGIALDSSNTYFEKSVVYNTLYYKKNANKTLIKVFDAPDTVVIDSDTTTIDSYALNGCTDIKELTIPFIGQSTRVADKANRYFSYIFGCPISSLSDRFTPVLDKLTISSATAEIPDEAFYNCTIKVFDLTASKDTLKRYGIGSFYNNYIMEGFIDDEGDVVSLYNPGTVAEFIIADYAFGQCFLDGNNVVFADGITYSNAIEIGSNVTYLGEGAYGFNDFKNIKISADISEIKAYSFYMNEGIIGVYKQYTENGKTVPVLATRIEIPATVKTIGDRAFNACEDSVSARLKSLNGNLTVVFGVGSILESFSESKTAGALSRAFMLSGVRTIAIPASVITIGWGAFNYCPLENFSLPQDSELVYLGAAFIDCTPFVEEINLPHTVKQISGSFNISKIEGTAECRLKKVTVGNAAQGSRLLWILTDSFNAYSLETLVLNKAVSEPSAEQKIELQRLEKELKDTRDEFDAKFDYALESELERLLDEMDRIEREIIELTAYNSMTKINYYLHYLLGEVWAFDDASEKLKIYVPANLVSVYKTDSLWSKYSDKFFKIV